MESKFEADDNRGLGTDYAAFKAAAKKVSLKTVQHSMLKVKSRPYYSNLTDSEIEELARLVNVPFHNTFTMFDLRTYFMKLSESRNH